MPVNQRKNLQTRRFRQKALNCICKFAYILLIYGGRYYEGQNYNYTIRSIHN